ncbi:MAG: hypothetical protein QNK11_01375 [Legionella sp.]|nr:hypothetical protein [Legionella sp.]
MSAKLNTVVSKLARNLSLADAKTNVMQDESSHGKASRRIMGVKNNADRKENTNLAYLRFINEYENNFILRWIMRGEFHLLILYLKEEGLILDDNTIIKPGATTPFVILLPKITQEKYIAVLNEHTNAAHIAALIAFAKQASRLPLIENLQYQLAQLPLVHFQAQNQLLTHALDDLSKIDISAFTDEVYEDLEAFQAYAKEQFLVCQKLAKADYKNADGSVNLEKIAEAEASIKNIFQAIGDQLTSLTDKHGAAVTDIFNTIWDATTKEAALIAEKAQAFKEELISRIDSLTIEEKSNYQERLVALRISLSDALEQAPDITQTEYEELKAHITQINHSITKIAEAVNVSAIRDELNTCAEALQKILPVLKPYLDNQAGKQLESSEFFQNILDKLTGDAKETPKEEIILEADLAALFAPKDNKKESIQSTQFFKTDMKNIKESRPVTKMADNFVSINNEILESLEELLDEVNDSDGFEALKERITKLHEHATDKHEINLSELEGIKHEMSGVDALEFALETAKDLISNIENQSPTPSPKQPS